MTKHRLYQNKGSKEILNPDTERFLDDEKNKKRLAKSTRHFLEDDRKMFVENAIEMNNVFEYRRKAKAKDAEVLTRAKNIIQSLVYLILNDDFYKEVQRIRGKISIPIKGFDSEKEYDSWALNYGKSHHSHRENLLQNKDGEKHLMSCGYDKVFKETELFIKNYKLCYAKDIKHLAPIISRFISRKLSFEKFVSFVYPSVYEHALHCRMDGKMCDRLQRGFEIDVVELEDSESKFFVNQWSYDIFPFTKLTGTGELFRDFYEREFYSEKNLKDYDVQYLKLQMKKLGVKNNKEKIKKNQCLNVIENDDFVRLAFTTNFFTRPSDIINLLKKEHPRIKRLLSSREDRIRKIQKLHLTEKFERNFQIWELQKKGMTYDEISGYLFDKGDELGDHYINNLKGELGEFKANIRDSLSRKIVF